MQLLCQILYQVILTVTKRFVFKTRCYTILWHLCHQCERHNICSSDVVCYPTCSINMCVQKQSLNHNLAYVSDCITFSCGKHQKKSKVFTRKKVQLSSCDRLQQFCRQSGRNFVFYLLKFLHLHELLVAYDFQEQDIE